MYPDLSYFFQDLFHTSPDNWLSIFKTFGVMLALAFVASSYVLKSELKRKEQEGLLKPIEQTETIGSPVSIMDIVSNGIFGFILGFKALAVYQNFEAFKFDPSAVVFSKEGSIIGGLIGFALFGFISYYEKNKKKLPEPKQVTYNVFPHQRVLEITFAAGIGGILGAKIFAIFESRNTLEHFVLDPFGTFFSGSGLAIYGGLVGGFIAVYYLIRKMGIKPIYMMDACAPAMMMGYAVGRIGCQLAGDGDWGIPAKAQPSWWFLPDWMWSYKYPHNVSLEGVPIKDCIGHYCNELAVGAYPTPFYETIMGLTIFGILWSIRKKLKVPGTLFFVYMLLNGIERLFIEQVRVNEKINAFGMSFTQAEMIAVIFMIIGVVGYFVLTTLSKKNQL
jgi:phosphatidylglycerol---prolipoprotein diacylglyceryl transferase